MIDMSSMIPQPWSEARSTLHRVWADAMVGPAWSSALRAAMGEIDLHLVWLEVEPDDGLTPRGLLFDHERVVADLLSRARVWALAATELVDCARRLRDIAHTPVGHWCAGAGVRCFAVSVAGVPWAGPGAGVADLTHEASVKIDTARTRVAYIVVHPRRPARTTAEKDPLR